MKRSVLSVLTIVLSGLSAGKGIICAQEQPYPKLRIVASGGFSYLTGRISENVHQSMRSYYRELKTGHHAGAGIHYFLFENIGLGLAYSRFRSTNQRDNVIVTYPSGQSRLGRLKDDLFIQYIGPVASVRSFSADRKTQFVSDFSLGYMAYRNDATLIDNYKLKGHTAGLMLKLGLEGDLDELIGMGVYVSLIYGVLTSIEYNGERVDLKNNPENISRIDLGIALRWNK